MSDLPEDAQPGVDDLDLVLDEDGEGEGQDPDLGGEGGEPPEPKPGDEPQDERQQRQPRRGEAHRWRQRYETLEREVADLRQRVTAPPQPSAPDPAAQARADQEERARLEQMTPLEQSQYLFQKGMQQTQHMMLQQQLSTQDLIDRQGYEADARTSRVHQVYQDRVERLLASERARGNVGVTRSALLAYLVGQDAIAKAGRPAPAGQRRAAAGVQRQTTRPASGRGDVARGGGTRDDAAADEALLRQITTRDL